MTRAVRGSAVAAHPAVSIAIGGVHASRDGALIKTLLGSCIAACLYDPITSVGGMNHFMLPRSLGESDEPARFGVHAMDCLIGALMKLGADRRRLVAKIFGGAHVLDMAESVAGVPQQNIRFIREFLQEEAIPVLSEDVGGYQPRQVHFYSGEGRVLVKRMSTPYARSKLRRVDDTAVVRPAAYGDITLFD